MKNKVAILAIGDELLNGRTADTNSKFLGAEFERLGFELKKVVVTGDDEEGICRELENLTQEYLYVVTTGGLGPTSDDLTRYAVAKVCGKKLVRRQETVDKLHERARLRGRTLHENNLRQADFPADAHVFLNSAGTADGFLCLLSSLEIPTTTYLLSLPGVPSEVQHLWQTHLAAWFAAQQQVGIRRHRQTLRFFGLSESYIGGQIEKSEIPSDIIVAYRPLFPEVAVSLSLDGENETECQKRLQAAAERCVKALGEAYLISRNESNLAQVTAHVLRERSQTLALAESCSGGEIAAQLVSIPGASEFFLGAVVSYSNEAKEVFLGVKAHILERFGAVSERVAAHMAYGARIQSGADFGLSVTGIAGPDGGSTEKPVGMVWIGLSTREGEQTFLHQLPMERNAFRKYVSAIALDTLRRKILGYPFVWEKL